MRIVIQTIPHENQRYPTVGDWVFTNDPIADTLHVAVSEMGNQDYEFLVGIHEQIEAFLCRKAGISEEAVTAFDKEFERNRVEGNTTEPGNDPDAPYYREHQFATSVENMLAHALRIDWDEYDKMVNSL